MMSNKHLIAGSTFVVVLLALLFSKIPVVRVSYSNGSFYLKDPTFEIGWIHSVEKEPWFERYALKNGSLYLVDTRFKTFGAGVPSEGEVIPSNDGYVHMKINRKMQEISLVVSKNVKTTMYTKKSKIPLYTLTDDYGTVTIESKKLPLWMLLRGDYK